MNKNVYTSKEQGDLNNSNSYYQLNQETNRPIFISSQ